MVSALAKATDIIEKKDFKATGGISATVSESKNSEVDSTMKQFLEYTWLKNQKKLINAYNKV